MDGVSILLWLVPPLVVTLLACCWVSWLGREQTSTIDREQAAARMGAALERQRQRDAALAAKGRRAPVPTRPVERSSGIAVRPSKPSRPGPVDEVPGQRRETVPRPPTPVADPTALPAWLDESAEGPRRTA